ncbi:MAG: hypothetical protein RL654_1577 [Pseudomonadota bacterium]|jgi:23S rRNA pseudouridine2605 synthase
MNENQENTPAVPDDQPAAEAPKKRRAPRKVAAEAQAVAPVADVAAEEAPKKRRAPRKVAAEAVEPQQASAPTAPVEPAGAAVPAAEEAPKKRRAPRKTAAAPETIAAVAAEVATPPSPVPLDAPAPAPVSPEPAAAVVQAATTVTPEPSAEDDVGEGGGRRGRNRRRGRRGERDGETAGTEAAAPNTEDGETIEEIIVAPDTGELDTDDLFAEVISGDYDASAEPAADEQADLGKRVLSPDPMAPKLHKVLAQAGIGSRREMEQLIQDGQVSVNGEAAHIGMRIEQGDQIRIAGRPIKVRIAPAPARVLAYHKQVGEVVTHHDPEGRPTVFRHLPRLQSGKWLSVGRLDINTEGLLLFTNSGDLANQLMHPRFGVEREYAVRVLGTLETEQRAKLLEGVDIDGQKAAFRSIEDGGGEGLNRWYRVVITEGRNREVRKLFDAVGLTVSRLIRIRYGTVLLPRGLKRGVWVEIGEYDLRTIRALAGMDGARAGGDGGRRGRGRDGERGAEPRAERGGRGDQPARGKGSQHGGDRGARGAQAEPRVERAERQDRPDRHERQDRPDRRQNGQGTLAQGPQGKKQRPPRGEGGAPRGASGRDRAPEPDRDLDGYDEPPMHIPNPLEQTFDRRFASGSKRISAGFGRPTEEPGPGNGGQGGGRKGPGQGQGQGGGQRQPDPMQTSVGYIGADAYFARPGGNKGRGGRRR